MPGNGLRMVDVHMHVLPGVDDGARTLEVSGRMLQMAWDQGIRAVITTPHSIVCRRGSAGVKEAFQRVRQLPETLQLPLRLFPGCEVHCEQDSMPETLQHLLDGEYLTLNGTSFVLTEFSMRVTPAEALFMVRELRAAGWEPVLAHVERCGGLFESPETIEALLAEGCLLQVNAYSLWNETRENIRNRAQRLLREEKIAFLGSDAHGDVRRPPRVADGLQYVLDTCRREYAEEIAFGNAERYLLSGS